MPLVFSPRRIVAVAMLAGMVCACGGVGRPQARSGPDQEPPLKLDGAVVLAEPERFLDLSSYDPSQLFALAAEAEAAGRRDDAIRIYHRLIADFPESELVSPARFNAALLLEATQRFAEAAALYEAIARAPAPSEEYALRTHVDAHFRWAVCLGKTGAWWDSVGVFDALLSMQVLSDRERLEAMVGRGIALEEAGEPPSAEYQYAAALRLFREIQDGQRFDDGGLAAEAAFRLGAIAATNFEGVVLEFPVELLRARLEQKCELLLSAQSRFLRAIQLGDAHTVAAAGFRIGSLYETLYDTIVGLALPPELDEEQGAVYREEVQKKVNVLVEKAIMVYEKSLIVGRRASSAAEWTGRLERALERLKAIFLASESPPG